jgi:CRISPR-associated protein Cmr5
VNGNGEVGSTDAGVVQNAEQRRAADALQAVHRIEKNEKLRKRYRAYVDRLGPSILMNGLGQALATERAAAGIKPEDPADRAHEILYRNVEGWLCRAGGVYPSGDLLVAIVGGSEAYYVRAQAEALAWLVWHKKFCRAFLPPSDGEED